MLTRIALFGFVLAAMPIASAQAEDRDYPRQIGGADGIFCKYEYSLSKLPNSATDPDKWWKTLHTMRVQKIECNGIDLGARDEEVEVKYRRATVKTNLIGELTVIVSGGENKNNLETELKPSQIRKIKRLSWLKVLVARNLIDATTEAAPKAKPINPNAVVDPTMPKGRLHYDVPCRVSSVGTCEPPQYPPYRPRP